MVCPVARGQARSISTRAEGEKVVIAQYKTRPFSGGSSSLRADQIHRTAEKGTDGLAGARRGVRSRSSLAADQAPPYTARSFPWIWAAPMPADNMRFNGIAL
jgi:hypothetical protein